jgi:pimeloyl-ACP methyl ester carboxylesterase
MKVVRAIGKVIRWTVVAWMAWRLVGPEILPHFEGRQEHPWRVPGRSVFVGQREFFVREMGPEDGPPLLLIHGWAYDSVGTWHEVAPLLAERRRVIAVDQRNHGRSDWIRGPYSIEDVADEVAGVMDALGISRADVAGYSMGGMVAQAMARRHPGKVARVVLAATAACAIPERRLAVRLAFVAGRAIARVSKTEGALVTRRYLLDVGVLEKRFSRWQWQEALRRDPTLYYEAGAAVWRFDSRSWIGRIEAPALVIINTDDQVLSPRYQYDLAARIEGAEVVEMQGSRHEGIWTRAGEYAAAINRFLGP